MRRPVLLIFVNAMILIVIFALLTQSLVVVQRIAQATRLKGSVQVQRGGRGEFTPLSASGLIKTSDVVRTGPNGTAEFRWADGTRWKILPGTQITVKKATYNMVKKAEQSQLELTTGKVFIRIMKALTPASKFEVETPTAVAAVRGTIFSVEVKNGRTEVAVFKGQVQVASAGRSGRREQAITPGKAAVAATPGVLQMVADAKAVAEFRQQESIVKPQLEVQIKSLKSGNKAIISGTTEAGNVVTINSKVVKTLGNGSFFKRVTLQPGHNTFTVVTTDQHGEQASRTISLPLSPVCREAPPAA